jgi:oxalate decarboxylase/phosphoglucose isomerase-like protein (cupin superfamily)
VDIRKLDRAALGPQNGHSQRLLPWPALNAPFEGAWNVVRDGTSTTMHAHHEYEIFVAVSGEAELLSAGERAKFAAGDIVFFPPGADHQVINDSGRDFEMFSVWWDGDMSNRFQARHAGEGQS